MRSLRLSLCHALLLLATSIGLSSIAGAWDPPAYLLQWGRFGTGRAEFDLPSDIIISKGGAPYVVDSGNNRIHIYMENGRHYSSFGSPGSGPGEFNGPQGIATNEVGHLYVTDSGNHRIQKFGSVGSFQLTWGSYGTGDGQFILPWDVTLVQGRVYVTDAGNHRIQKFDESGNFIGKWNLSDPAGAPRGIAADSLGRIFVTDIQNHRVEMFDTTGAFITMWGSHGSGDGEFKQPAGIAIDYKNRIYVADAENNRVQVFYSPGVFAGSWGSYGSQPGEFQLPTSVAIGPDGSVHVLDRAPPRAQKFVIPGKNKMFWAEFGSEGNGWIKFGGLSGTPWDVAISAIPQDVAWDVAVDHTRGKIYWSEIGNQKIQRANLDGGNRQLLIDTGDPDRQPQSLVLDVIDSQMYWIEVRTLSIRRAHIDGYDDHAIVSSGLVHPNGLAMDHHLGKIYWTDSGTDKIMRANLDGSNIEEILTGLTYPLAIALDAKGGKLYWTDSGDDTIERANLDGSTREVLVNTGLVNPYGLSLDTIGSKIYWTDAGVSSSVIGDGDIIKRANMSGGNIETLITSDLENPHGIDVVTSERCLGFQIMRVLGDYNNWDDSLPSMTEIKPCVWEDTVSVPLAGCFNIKFRTDGEWDIPADYGNCIQEDASCQEAWSGRVCRISGGSGVGQIHFPISGDYVFRLDERAQTYEITSLDLVGVEEEPLAASLKLSPAQPNPFNESTVFRYTLPQKATVRLSVYDIAGRRIRLFEEGQMEAGAHLLRWDGRDDSGRLVPPGVYLYRLNDGNSEKTHRAIMIR
jgi:DNA-binding beta-propeller fold protein YncE